MSSGSHASVEDEVPEYLEHSVWPFLIAMAIGVAMTGLLLLLKGFIWPAAVLLMLSFGAVLGGFLYSDTRHWKSTVSKSMGKIPAGGVVGPFPVDISLTMQLIILTEVLLFGGAFAMYFAIRVQNPIWPPPGTPVLDDSLAKIQTLALVSSSIVAEYAISRVKRGNMKAFKAGLLGATLLGVVFIVVIFGIEWPRLIFGHILTPASGFFGATFFLLTGIHGAHVVAGVIAFSYTDARAFMGQYSPKNYGFAEAASTYWHFVDIIWLLLFALLWQGTRIIP